MSDEDFSKDSVSNGSFADTAESNGSELDTNKDGPDQGEQRSSGLGSRSGPFNRLPLTDECLRPYVVEVQIKFAKNKVDQNQGKLKKEAP